MTSPARTHMHEWGRARRHAATPLLLRQLARAAQLKESVPAEHAGQKHAIGLQHPAALAECPLHGSGWWEECAVHWFAAQSQGRIGRCLTCGRSECHRYCRCYNVGRTCMQKLLLTESILMPPCHLTNKAHASRFSCILQSAQPHLLQQGGDDVAARTGKSLTQCMLLHATTTACTRTSCR